MTMWGQGIVEGGYSFSDRKGGRGKKNPADDFRGDIGFSPPPCHKLFMLPM